MNTNASFGMNRSSFGMNRTSSTTEPKSNYGRNVTKLNSPLMSRAKAEGSVTGSITVDTRGNTTVKVEGTIKY